MNTETLIGTVKRALKHCGKETFCVFDGNHFNPKVVAWHHREMFRLHDLQKWGDLQQNAQKMLVALGYRQECARKASEFILRAYQDTDRAVEAQEKNDLEKERKAYADMVENFTRANKYLHLETGSLKYKMDWHKAARHGRPLLVAYNLFREHLKRFGILRLRLVISTTWTAFLGGYFAHKKHDWEELEVVTTKYWRHIHRVYAIRPPVQI